MFIDVYIWPHSSLIPLCSQKKKMGIVGFVSDYVTDNLGSRKKKRKPNQVIDSYTHIYIDMFVNLLIIYDNISTLYVCFL